MLHTLHMYIMLHTLHMYIMLHTLHMYIYVTHFTHVHYVALPAKNIKVINSFYKGMHDMQRCLRF